MTFLLRDIPGEQVFDRFSARYPSLDPEATEAFLRMMRLGSDYLGFLDGLLEPYHLRHGRWITLILLMREPDRSQLPSVLAEKQGVTRATMTGLIDGLEAEGLVERTPDPGDGRRWRVWLTEAGAARLDAIMPGYYHAVADLMSAYTPTELEQLLRLLRKAPQP